MIEVWKQTLGFPGYSVSNYGRIKHVLKNGMERILSGFEHRQGYRRVGLTLNGKYFARMIHCLVAEAFIGSRPDGNEVNHIDGNKSNNHAENLEYVTPIYNVHHSMRNGLQKTKLTKDQVIEIRKQYANGENQYDLAHKFEISQPTVSELVNRKRWRWANI